MSSAIAGEDVASWLWSELLCRDTCSCGLWDRHMVAVLVGSLSRSLVGSQYTIMSIVTLEEKKDEKEKREIRPIFFFPSRTSPFDGPWSMEGGGWGRGTTLVIEKPKLSMIDVHSPCFFLWTFSFFSLFFSFACHRFFVFCFWCIS